MQPRPLSKEELQTLRLFANGLSTDEIAERLSVQKADVQDRLRVATRKLGAVNRVHAVALATDHGIIKIAGGRARQLGAQSETSSLSDDEIETLIRERAYHIWLEEGKPHGFHREHWAQAEVEILKRLWGAFLPENIFGD